MTSSAVGEAIKFIAVSLISISMSVAVFASLFKTLILS